MQPYVLVVIAEQDAREAVAEALVEAGCTVTTAASGGDATILLDEPEQRRPDLLVLDDRGATGGDAAGGGAAVFLERFHAEVEAPVLLIASGHASEPISLADEIVVRPLTTEALAETVSRVLPGLLQRSRRSTAGTKSA